MQYFLAVDSGGTKAEFLLADETRELARATCGTIKRVNADAADAARHLDAALAELERVTRVRMSQITSTCIGTSGNTVPLVTDWLRESFAGRVAGALTIVGDVEIALDAVFHGERGVLVLAGTGSNVAARMADGTIQTAGGWGPMLADQGSGHWIGMEGLRRGFLARDQGKPTSLLAAACALWNLPEEDALIEFANAQPAARYAAKFAPSVVALAEQGDPVAAGILKQGGRDLAYLASLLIERMRAAESTAFVLPQVAIAGSILAKVERERMALEQELTERYPGIAFIQEPADPVLGALWRARLSA
ncbi:MAG TPA: BadF/BadG/BcrA/BcrD ATPase family protein [Terracidiphilus sp.]|nr:BadF/BadG/BcrA/BcrD ATPase family protein [Terracidiphilus sp.]